MNFPTLNKLIKKQVRISLLEMERHDDQSVSGKTAPNITLELIYNSTQDIAIFQDKQGDIYVYDIESVPKYEYEEYADREISFDGRDEDGFPDTSTSEWGLEDNVINNYVNDNISKLSKGVGLSDYEDGAKSLIKVDDTLKKSLIYIIQHIKDPNKKMKLSKALLEQKIKKTILSVIKEDLEVSPSGLEDKKEELPEFTKEVELFIQSFKDYRFIMKGLSPKLRTLYSGEDFEEAYDIIVDAFEPYYEKYGSNLGYHFDSFLEWVKGIKEEERSFESSGSFATALADEEFFFGEAYDRYNLEDDELKQLAK